MCKKIVSFVLIGLVLNLACYSTVLANPEKEDKFVTKLKTALLKLGTGPEARIQVKLKDKTKLKGYVSEINENSFVVFENKTNAATQIPYSQVRQVKGKNNMTGEDIALTVLVFLLILSMFFGGGLSS